MVFSFIKKPESSVTWNRQETVKTQYFTTQLSTLTYSTTGVMSSTTSGTFTTTARAATLSSNVSYSYQEGNVYSTSMTSTTIGLPDGRTATSFGTMSTELKYSYYPNRKQTGDKYVAVNNNYVGNIYSTLASSTRRSCIIFEQDVSKTINTYISSVYTPAYLTSTTSTIETTLATVTGSRHLFGQRRGLEFTSTNRYTFDSYTNGETELSSSVDWVEVDKGKYSDGFKLSYFTMNWGVSNATTQGFMFNWYPDISPNISVTVVGDTTNYSRAKGTAYSQYSIRSISTWSKTSSGTFLKGSSTKSSLYTAYENPEVSISYTESYPSLTTATCTTTTLSVPDFDGKISTQNIADSMYYTLNYTYPFNESKTSYILRSDSITHQYYRSTTKEVRV